ncbi:MAG: response regulator [Cyclobacteriaceae bacterium]
MSAPKHIALSFLILVWNTSIAQNLLPNDSIRNWVLEIKQIAENYPDSAKGLIKTLRSENPELPLEIEADLLKVEGAIAVYTRMLDTAMVKFEKSGDVYQQIIENREEIGDTLDDYYFDFIKSRSNIINNIGGVAYYKGDHEQSVLKFIEASEIQKSLLNCPTEAVRESAFRDYTSSIDNISSIYRSMEQYDKALEYSMKAHAMLGDRRDRLSMRFKLSIAQSYYKTNKNDSVKKYISQILLYADTVSMANEYYTASSMMGSYYLAKDQLDSAFFYLNRATKEIDEMNISVTTELHHQRLGEYYLKIMDYENALGELKKSLGIVKATQTKGSLTKTYKLLHETYLEIARTNKSIYDYELAVGYLQKNIQLNDSLTEAQRFKEFNELQSKYEAEKKEAENNFLRSETANKEQTISNQQKWILAFAVLFSIAIILLIFQIRSRLLLSKQKVLIQDQKNKLAELDATKSRFFANLSHDLRTPITLIMGNLKIVNSDEGGYLSVQGERSCQKAYENANKLLSLSDEIRDLTSLEDGQLSLIFKKVSIQEYLNLLVSMFKSAADVKGIELIFEAGSKTDFNVHLDPKQFEKVIYNLLSNALKFTSKGEQISLKVSEVDSRNYYISITDTGKGIKEEQLPYIFDRYYQSPENDYYMVEGLGIGLSLAKELVALHGGDISVESQLGEGTTFNLTIPKNLHQEADNHVISVSDYMKAKSSDFKNNLTGSKKRVEVDNSYIKESTVLIVDDHIEIREYISTFILDKYNVFYAGNGVEALELLEKTKIDLIITDLMMPVMDGLELLDLIKEKKIRVPVMVVSARTLSNDKQKILSKGVNEFISKPFDENEFINRVNNIISNKEYQESAIVTNKEFKKEIQNDIIAKINDLLHERLQEPKISVQDIASTIFASERKTFRLIKELTGFTPQEYITDFRLSVAKNLLNQNEFTSLAEISNAVGIGNSTRFAKVYEEKFGYHPSTLLIK